MSKSIAGRVETFLRLYHTEIGFSLVRDLYKYALKWQRRTRIFVRAYRLCKAKTMLAEMNVKVLENKVAELDGNIDELIAENEALRGEG
jgi:hypothetical protein